MLEEWKPYEGPKPRITVYLGASGSGKDWWRANEGPIGAVHIHPIAPWKRFLERTFTLPEGSLDEQGAKSRTIPGTDVSYQEYMVQMWHAHKELGVSIAVPMLRNQLKRAVQAKVSDVTITGVRTLEEAQTIIDTVNEYSLDLYVEVLYNRGKIETSDTELLNILGLFSTEVDRMKFINNA